MFILLETRTYECKDKSAIKAPKIMIFISQITLILQKRKFVFNYYLFGVTNFDKILHAYPKRLPRLTQTFFKGNIAGTV